MTALGDRIAAEAQKMRDGLEAGMLADELGCEVTPHPGRPGHVEARNPLPGVSLVAGTLNEVRDEVRREGLRAWLRVLGGQCGAHADGSGAA